MSTSKLATSAILQQQEEVRRTLPFTDRQDFADAERGLVAPIDGPVLGDNGTVLWDNATYSFLGGDAPDTVNPSLWRQSSLVARQGLYEVVEGIYQVRGLDLSNVTFVEGDTGVIVIDPLISKETASAALALYREHRGDRPVTGVIYTHSHVDHFGGVKRVTTQEDVDAGRVQVLAPVVRGRKGTYKKELAAFRERGFVRVRIDGVDHDLGEEIALARSATHEIDLVVDRVAARESARARIAESIETALAMADGLVKVESDDARWLFSQANACIDCGTSFPEIAPRSFSFNSPHGACPGEGPSQPAIASISRCSRLQL